MPEHARVRRERGRVRPRRVRGLDGLLEGEGLGDDLGVVGAERLDVHVLRFALPGQRREWFSYGSTRPARIA